jgi:hypothetical protein
MLNDQNLQKGKNYQKKPTFQETDISTFLGLAWPGLGWLGLAWASLG